MQAAWFIALICSICLEGLGRRYLPTVPAVVFYYLKDLILLYGYLAFRPTSATTKVVRYLYRGFGIVWIAAFGWTVMEVFNPSHQSLVLALIGLRSYWLWWMAPLVIAGVLADRKTKEKAVYALLFLCVGIAGLAAIQFASPADSAVNMYSVWNGEELYASQQGMVVSTGHARVASTFAYISGFTNFTVLVPALLLSLGLDSENPKVRRAALLGTLATAVVVPMSGSRQSIVTGLVILFLTLWTARLFFTRIGRRVMLGAGVAVILAIVVFPEALLGVQNRFEENQEETRGRFEQMAMYFPALPIANYTYPALGLGTGMQQNAKAAFNIATPEWDIEIEPGRFLVELGPVGFLLVWCARLGLMTALFRCYGILKRAGRRGSAAAALSYGALTMIGNMTFDHVWQALYFVGCGFILAEVIAVQKAAALARAPIAASVLSPGAALPTAASG